LRRDGPALDGPTAVPGDDAPTERARPGAPPGADADAAAGAPTRPAQDLATPRRIAGYDILDALGAGGMGVVYRARHQALGKEVALKVLHGGSESEAARLLLEARAMAGLSHPHVVPVHDVGRAGSAWYLAMDLVTGGTLAGLIRDCAARRATEGRLRGPVVPLDQALSLLERIAGAVAHAHERGIIHRDLKPSNVLLRADGEPLVADFGLARHVAVPQPGDTPGAPGGAPSGGAPGTPPLTRTGEVLGTPAYMAPEQAESDGAVDERADVYALGGILYEMLTGRAPVETTGRLAQDLVRVLTVDPTPPRALVPTLPSDVETILLTALAREPARRYPSARALAEDVRRYREGLGIVARRPSLAARVARFARRRRTALLSGAVGAAAALAVGLAVTSLLERRRALLPPPWEVVYASTFDRAADLGAFRVTEGTWRIEGGDLAGFGDGSAAISLARFLTGDVRVTMRATLEPRTGGAGDLSVLLAPALGPGTAGTEDSHFLGFGSNGNTLSKLMRGERRTAVAEGEAARITPGRAHEVTAVRAGGLVSLAVDGRTILERRELFPVAPDRAVEATLYTWIGRARIHDLTVERRAPLARAGRLAFADWVLTHGDPAQAARLYADEAAAPDLGPLERAEARVKEGRALLRAGGDAGAARARSLFEEAVAARPSAELALTAELGLAEADLLAGALGACLRRVESALAREPSPFARSAVDDLLQRAEERLLARTDRAGRLEVLRTSLALFPGEPERLIAARRAEAHLLAESGRVPEALRLLEEARGAARGNPFRAAWIEATMGAVRARAGDLAGARRDFEAALAAAGADAFARLEALLEAASVELEVGQPAEALAAVERAEALPGPAAVRAFALAVLRARAELALRDGAATDAAPSGISGSPADPIRRGLLGRLDALSLGGEVGPDRANDQEFAVQAALGAAVSRVTAGEIAEARGGLGRALVRREIGVHDDPGAWALAAALDIRAGDPRRASPVQARLARRATASERALAHLLDGVEAAARGDAEAARRLLEEAAKEPLAPRWIAPVARALRP